MKQEGTKRVDTSGNERPLALEGGTYVFEMPVRWGDLDAIGHVNNAVYMRYLEEARACALRAARINVGGRTRNIVLAHISCDFLRPIGWPAELRINMTVQRVGRSSLEYVAEIHVVGDEQGPCTRALNIVVGTDAATGRPSPWTQAELQGLASVFVQGGA